MRIKNALTILFLLLPLALYSAEAVNPETFLQWYDFEKTPDWTTDDWNNNALSKPELSDDYVSSGRKSLEIKLDATRAGQQGVIQLFDAGSLAGVKEMKFDIYNSSLSNMKVFLMLKTGTNWLYHESRRRTIVPGWNKGITFDLSSQIFGSEGNYNAGIKDIGNVRRLGIVAEPEKAATGFIVLDNVQINGPKAAGIVPEKDPPNLQEVLIDSFETGRLKWSAASTWSCSTSTDKTSEKASAGNSAMKASFNLKMPGQNAVFMVEDSVDLTDIYEIKVDIYYPYDFPTNMSMALSTTDKWIWQESKSSKLKKGWNRDVTFALKEKKWKNEKSKWDATVLPEGVKDTRRICFLVFPPDMGDGYIIMDNIRAKTSAPEKLANLMPQDTGNLAFYPWNSFEKGVNWETMSDQSGAIAVKPAFDFGGETNRGMEAAFSTQSNVDKAMYAYKGNIDFSNSAGIKVDIFNPNAYAVKIALAFQTGDDEIWIETKQMGIGPGWNREIYFDFSTASFKSAESNWNYTEYFKSRDDIRQMFFQVYPDQKTSGSLFLSDFKLARKNYLGDAGKVAGLTFNNSSRISVEPISYEDGPIDGKFENASALNNWGAANIAGWGAAMAGISEMYASKGANSLKVQYKDTGNKFGIQYAGTAPFDVSQYKYMAFDIYNPGKTLKMSLAFKTGTTSVPANIWYETNEQIILYPGWNKNVKIDITAPEWKKIVSGVQNSPIVVDNLDKIQFIYLVFTNAFEGTLYLDNVRWGKESDLAISDAAVEQDINLEITPFDNLTAKVTFNGSYYHGQNTGLSVKSASISLRGFGNELNFFSGVPVKVFDDPFGLISSETLGPNVMGLSLAGTIYPLNTSYLITGLSLDNTQPWFFGSTYVAAARLKTYLLDRNYVGAVFMSEMRGFNLYDGISQVFGGELEQGTYVVGGDTSVSVPVADLFDMNVKGEYLCTTYATMDPIFLIDGEPPVYVAQNISEDANKLFSYTEVNMHYGYLTLYGYYRHIGGAFASNYVDTDYRAGMANKDVKITYTMDDVPPFSIIKSLNPELAAFVRNTNLMVEYDAGRSLTDAYSRETVTIDLKNDESLALYNYHIWAKYNYEGNETLTPSFTLTGLTKILVADLVTFRLLGRMENTKGPIPPAYTSVENYTSVTGFIEASVKFLKDFKFTASYKAMAGKGGETHGNIYAALDGSLLNDSLEFTASYGDSPLTGYWLDDGSNDTVNKYMLTIKGRF